MSVARGDRVTLISRHDGTRVPAIITTPPARGLIQARLAGAPVGTPLRLEHWAIESRHDLPFDVTTWLGEDGTPVVQIDTHADAGRIRVNLNDPTIWDGDPERDEPLGRELCVTTDHCATDRRSPT